MIFGLFIVAVTLDGIDKKFQYQIDQLKKENKRLRDKLFQSNRY